MFMFPGTGSRLCFVSRDVEVEIGFAVVVWFVVVVAIVGFVGEEDGVP
jgi:hypothetical protein